MSKTIRVPLGRGTYSALIDAADLSLITGYNWYRHGNGHGGWYVRGYPTGAPKPHAWVYMHQLIHGRRADHVNRDGLDNRRVNLRDATASQQGANQVSRGGTSQYKGVYWSTVNDAWVARITVNYRCMHLGSYASEEAAARAYDAAARELFGAYARLNLPPAH